MSPCWKKKYIPMFSTIRATVTIGKLTVGMLSLSGIKRRVAGYATFAPRFASFSVCSAW